MTRSGIKEANLLQIDGVKGALSNEYFANISEVSRYFLVFFVRAALCRKERTINKAQKQANPEIPKYNDLLMLKPVADPTSGFSLKHLMAGARCACKRQEVILDDIINYEVQTYVQKLIKKNFHPKTTRKKFFRITTKLIQVNIVTCSCLLLQSSIMEEQLQTWENKPPHDKQGAVPDQRTAWGNGRFGRLAQQRSGRIQYTPALSKVIRLERRK